MISVYLLLDYFNLKNAVGFKRKAIYLHIIILLWIKGNFYYIKLLTAIQG